MKRKWFPIFTIYGIFGLIFQLVASVLFKKFGWDYDTGGIATWLFFLYPVISFPYWVLGESGIFTTWTAVNNFLVLLICGSVDLSIFCLIKLRLKKRLAKEY